VLNVEKKAINTNNMPRERHPSGSGAKAEAGLNVILVGQIIELH
jgi:hypothetical protein